MYVRPSSSELVSAIAFQTLACSQGSRFLDPCVLSRLCRCPSIASLVGDVTGRLRGGGRGRGRGHTHAHCDGQMYLCIYSSCLSRERHCTLASSRPRSKCDECTLRSCDRGHVTLLPSYRRAISEAAPTFAHRSIHSRCNLLSSQRRTAVAVSAGF